jgi:hypothetical protein
VGVIGVTALFIEAAGRWLAGADSVIVTDRVTIRRTPRRPDRMTIRSTLNQSAFITCHPTRGYTDMMTMLIRHQASLWFLAVATSPSLSALAEIKATATRSLTVQPAGPRQGEARSRYFNVEGVKKGRYASFGALVFELPKGEDQAGDVETMSLQLVQSNARFTQDGKVRFFLTEPSDRPTHLRSMLAARCYSVRLSLSTRERVPSLKFGMDGHPGAARYGRTIPAGSSSDRPPPRSRRRYACNDRI